MTTTAGGASLISTEGPILLGYLAVVAALFIIAAVLVIVDPETRARRARNAAARARRAELAAQAARWRRIATETEEATR